MPMTPGETTELRQGAVERGLLFAGALLGATAVAAGAFGAHGLKAHVSPADLAIFETAARYQLAHALAVFAAVWLAERQAPRLGRAAAACFVAGSIVFAGSLYVLVLSGVRGWGAVTPVGGVLLIAGWLCLAGAALRRCAHG